MLLRGDVSFPQSATLLYPKIYSRNAVPEKSDDHLSTSPADIDQPLYMTELHAALARVNLRSATGLDNVTVAGLRNLPESSLRLLLDGITWFEWPKGFAMPGVTPLSNPFQSSENNGMTLPISDPYPLRAPSANCTLNFFSSHILPRGSFSPVL